MKVKVIELGYIYLVAADEMSRYKIGYTNSYPEARLENLQTSSPCRLRLISHARGRLEDERKLHEAFASQRVHREWFAFSDEEVAELVQMFDNLNPETAADRLDRAVEGWIAERVQTAQERRSRIKDIDSEMIELQRQRDYCERLLASRPNGCPHTNFARICKSCEDALDALMENA